MGEKKQMKDKIILIYGLAPMQLLQLHSLGQPLGIRVIAVPDSRTAMKVEALLMEEEGKGLPALALSGRFALLHGFGGQESMAAALINQVSPGVIKAVHTAHNGDWRFSDLAGELLEEHAQMTRR